MNYIASTGRKDIIYRDIISSKAAEQRLIQEGGKRQVPCLFIDGKPLYESDDIIAWLSQNPPIE